MINPGYSFLAMLKWKISVRYESNLLVVLRQFSGFTRIFKIIISPEKALNDWPCLRVRPSLHLSTWRLFFEMKYTSSSPALICLLKGFLYGHYSQLLALFNSH